MSIIKKKDAVRVGEKGESSCRVCSTYNSRSQAGGEWCKRGLTVAEVPELPDGSKGYRHGKRREKRVLTTP